MDIVVLMVFMVVIVIVMAVNLTPLSLSSTMLHRMVG